MDYRLGLTSLGTTLGLLGIIHSAWADRPLTVVYPPNGHETTAAQIFLIGSAPASGTVTVNGQAIARSPAGHFAPSFPLQLGDNTFTLRYGGQTVTLRVVRQPNEPPAPVGVAFGEGSLTPTVDIARMPGEVQCFEAIAPPRAQVSVSLAGQTIPLLPEINPTTLPPNAAVLTSQNQPLVITTHQRYRGCTALTSASVLVYGNNRMTGAVIARPEAPLSLGRPVYRLQLNGQTVQQEAPGQVELLTATNPPVIEVTAAAGTARSGPSTDFSRLTPLPQGTRAAVTGREGEWFRMDYGPWIRAREVRLVPNAPLPHTLIRSARARQVDGWTEMVFPLQVPVPITVTQGDRTFTLTLHNTTAQTDTIFLTDDPLIQRLDWQQISPTQVQYTFNLKTAQQWGYKLRYEGTSLILSLRHPPRLAPDNRRPLAGLRILVDPGHGGPEDLGARGPTGVPEKEVTLTVSRLLQRELEQRGATVILTREGDVDLGPNERAAMINAMAPDLALSIHYNALPDAGDAVNTAGVSTFWYNTQSHSLAMFLHNYLVERLGRPSDGVYWNNLALTRPTVAPAVLLELGFMINPVEFEWIIDPREQQRLAEAIAQGVVAWLQKSR